MLELGGNAGAIVDATADLDWAAKRMVIGAFAYAGQICISVQRLFVHDSVYEPFMERFIAAATGLKLGDPLDPATDVGPMVDANAVGRTKRWVDEAVALGGELLLGGEPKGLFFPPTILSGVPVTARSARTRRSRHSWSSSASPTSARPCVPSMTRCSGCRPASSCRQATNA